VADMIDYIGEESDNDSEMQRSNPMMLLEDKHINQKV
jgi:hypothetical protein